MVGVEKYLVLAQLYFFSEVESTLTEKSSPVMAPRWATLSPRPRRLSYQTVQ